jgi:hypothetical protein
VGEQELLKFDASQLTYQEWLRFFFDRPIGKEVFREERQRYFFVAEAERSVVARHLKKMCSEHNAILGLYSGEQVNQGLWAIFATFSYHEVIFDSSVDLDLRIQCIESMYHVYSDVVAHLAGDVRDTFYWMWWDYIGHEPWAYSQLQVHRIDREQTLDAIIRTLARILDLPHRGCQWSALHGLGHLDHHPKARDIVQQYLDLHGASLSDEDRRWVEACRDGNVL